MNRGRRIRRGVDNGERREEKMRWNYRQKKKEKRRTRNKRRRNEEKRRG